MSAAPKSKSQRDRSTLSFRPRPSQPIRFRSTKMLFRGRLHRRSLSALDPRLAYRIKLPLITKRIYTIYSVNPQLSTPFPQIARNGKTNGWAYSVWEREWAKMGAMATRGIAKAGSARSAGFMNSSIQRTTTGKPIILFQPARTRQYPTTTAYVHAVDVQAKSSGCPRHRNQASNIRVL